MDFPESFVLEIDTLQNSAFTFVLINLILVALKKLKLDVLLFLTNSKKREV